MIKYFIAIFCLISIDISAQLPVTETAYLNNPKTLQLELGILYENLTPKTKNYSIPTSTIHYTINKKLELILSNSFNFNIDDEKSFNNFPLTFGLKVPIINKENTVFSIAPFATGNIETNQKFTINPSTYLLFSHHISSKILVEANFGTEYDFLSSSVVYNYSTVSSFNFNSKFNAYVEIYGNFSIANHPHHHLNAGFYYSLNNKIQIAAGSGFGLNSYSTQYFAYFGGSFQFFN